MLSHRAAAAAGEAEIIEVTCLAQAVAAEKEETCRAEAVEVKEIWAAEEVAGAACPTRMNL